MIKSNITRRGVIGNVGVGAALGAAADKIVGAAHAQGPSKTFVLVQRRTGIPG